MTGTERPVARGFLALGLGEALARLLAFAAMVVAARRLGPAMYGVVGVASALTLYLNRVVDWGLELGLGVREVAARRESLARALPALLTSRLLLASALIAAAVALSLAMLPAPDAAVVATTTLTLTAVALGTRWAHIGLGQTRTAAVGTVVGQALFAVLLVALVRGPGDVARVPLAQLAGDLGAALLWLLALRRAGQPLPVRLDRAVVAPLVPRGAALMASALLGIFIFNAGLIFLRTQRGAAAAGYYTAAYTLVTFFLNVGIAYSLALLPELTRTRDDPGAQRRVAHTAAAQVLTLSLPIAVGGALLAGEVASLFYGPGYGPAGRPLGILLWTLPLCVLRDVPIMVLQATGRESAVLRLTAWAAGINLVLTAVLVARYGLVGAAWAGVATEAARLALAYGSIRQQGLDLPPIRRLWRTGLALAAMAGAVLAVPGLMVLLRVGIGGVAYLSVLTLTGAIQLRAGGRPRLAV